MMRAKLTIELVNQETAVIFKRKLKNGDNFMQRVSVKLGLLIKKGMLNNACALVALYKLHDEMIDLAGYFDDEKDKYEGLLEKRKILKRSKINFIARFQEEMDCSNALSLSLIELIEGFDALLSALNLLHLSGLIDGRTTFYQLKEQYQKKLNGFLSKIITAPSFKKESLSVEDVIASADERSLAAIDLELLKEALNAPYAPGFSQHQLGQLAYKIKQALLEQKKSKQTLTAGTN